MAALQFEIESYTATAVRDNATHYEIKLTSKDQGHGIRFIARLIFWDPVDDNKTGFIANLEGLNFDPRKVEVYYHPADFGPLYQVLSTESPVYYWVAYGDQVSNDPSKAPLSTHLVIQAQLKTGSEVPGDFEK